MSKAAPSITIRAESIICIGGPMRTNTIVSFNCAESAKEVRKLEGKYITIKLVEGKVTRSRNGTIKFKAKEDWTSEGLQRILKVEETRDGKDLVLLTLR